MDNTDGNKKTCSWFEAVFSGMVMRMSAVVFLLLTPVLLFTDESTRGAHSLAGAGSYNIQKGIEPNIFYFDLLYTYSRRFFQAMAGMQTTSANTDGLFKVTGYPLYTARHRIGVGMTYHISALHDIGTEHNLIAGAEYRYTVPDRFMLFVHSGYLHKWLKVPIPKHPTVVIDNSSLALAFHLTGIIKKEWHIGFGMSSYELFRYPLFANPSINATLDYHSSGSFLPKGFHLGLSFAVRYSDLLTLSGYPENFVIRTVLEVTIQK